MATKSMIRQKLGQKTFTSYVPATADDAKALVDAVMPGEVEIYEKIGETGNETVSDGYKKFTVMLKSEETDAKTYLNLVIPKAKNSSDIIAALKGKTINNVKADIVYVLNEREYTVAGGDSGDSE